MANSQNDQTSNVKRTINKLLLSGFVVVSFAAYALNKPSSPIAVANTGSLLPTQDPQGQQPVSPTQTDPAPTATIDSQNLSTTSLQPTDTAVPQAPTTPPQPLPTATSNGLYKDGSYVGAVEDAYYGMVQVKTIIQNHKIADVQFLQYPSDRRTSQRINSIAMPYLQQEAITVQSANVDIISGATLTSQAFAQSLQTTLDKARN